MALDVRMPDILAERAVSGRMRLELPYREGMTAADVVSAEGFSKEEAEAIMVIVNGEQVLDDTPLQDGDVVEFVIAMVGGQVPPAEETAMNVEMVDLPAMRTAGLEGELARAGDVWMKLAEIAGPTGLMTARKSISIMPTTVITDHQPDIRYEAAIILDEGVPVPDGLTERQLPAGRYAQTAHVGPYDGLSAAWSQFTSEWLPSSGHTLREGFCFEIYRNGPSDPPETLRTDLYIPIA